MLTAADPKFFARKMVSVVACDGRQRQDLDAKFIVLGADERGVGEKVCVCRSQVAEQVADAEGRKIARQP